MFNNVTWHKNKARYKRRTRKVEKRKGRKKKNTKQTNIIIIIREKEHKTDKEKGTKQDTGMTRGKIIITTIIFIITIMQN